MTIKEIALQKKAEYENGYTEWCVSNPGKISLVFRCIAERLLMLLDHMVINF